MKKINRHINILIWSLVGLYLAVNILVNVPVVQSFIGSQIAGALSQKLNAKVSIGRVNVGLLNRIIIDDVALDDQKGQPLLRAARLSAKLDYLALAQGRISVTSAQLFGMKANLYQEHAGVKPNFQFVIDSLASKDTTRHTPLNLELKSVIIRHGSLTYNRLDKPRSASFDPNHLNISNLSSHLILNTLRDDSVNLNVKRLSFKEQAGIDVEALSFRFVANNQRANLNNFELQLPQSKLRLGDVALSYELVNKKFKPSTLRYSGSIRESYVSPTDIACLVPKSKMVGRPIVIKSAFAGSDRHVQIHRLQASLPRSGNATAIWSPADIRLDMSGNLNSAGKKINWTANFKTLMVNRLGMEIFGKAIPEEIKRLNNISYRGVASGYDNNLKTRGVLLSDAGNAQLDLMLNRRQFAGHVKTDGLNLKQILNDNKFGLLATNIDIEGNTKQKFYKAKGNVRRIDYNNYAYTNLVVDGIYSLGKFTGQLQIDDPNLQAYIDGTIEREAANVKAQVKHFNPKKLQLFHKELGDALYSADIVASFKGKSLNTATGKLDVTHFTKTTADHVYTVDSLRMVAGNNRDGHYLTMRSDFADVNVSGKFDYTTIIQSFKNAIVGRLPGIQHLTPIKYKKVNANDFAMRATINRSDWLRRLFGIEVELRQPMHITGSMRHGAENIEANIFAPDINYKNKHYKDLSIVLSSPENSLTADVGATRINPDGSVMEYRVEASAKDDQLLSVLSLDNHSKVKRLAGRLNSITKFARNSHGGSEARLSITPSEITIGDSAFVIHPSNIIYSKNHLEVNNFAITGGNQHIKVNGISTKNTNDSLIVDLNDVNVSYILGLLNFHAVEFSGYASGRAYVSYLFGKPDARAKLRVDDFKFENGRMGTLHANVDWNQVQEEVDIEAQAVDTMHVAGSAPQTRTTDIRGYVSPKRNYIDLAINADKTRAEFVGTFCSSFMNNVDLTADGRVRLWGDLKNINLTGELVANGKLKIIPTNTEYFLHNDTVQCLVNEIRFVNDSVRDRNGNVGLVNGSLYHDHLSDLTFDLGIKANNMLAYDWGPSYGSTFFGTVYGTGDVTIKGGGGDVNIDVNVTPEKGSQIVYDVSSPGSIDSREFIHWVSRDSIRQASADSLDLLPVVGLKPLTAARFVTPAPEMSANIHINFLVNTNPDATLKLIMDKATGDYINLNGSGMIRAAYYNKGGIDIFGNYVIDHGVYKLTIQNIIKRDFEFTPGGTIVFGGDPYDANLNLNAQYILNSVSLSDLQVGRSFSSNNIRVNCLMNISGTPKAPKIDFNLDMPTVGNDAKQMVYSLINSEEEMNQQVLYLLAVGRFYSQTANNAGGTGDNRTSLAMQSILSGQISQQLNTVLSSVIKDANWNFGANISPGNEGWNNAEYEGLLSGRMLNNRLLFNGQFGYRDNKYATTTFIGDFDLRYLITPNGNFSVRVYNQTNDRYFTRNSLNTQGVGFIIKKDFDNWRSLFRTRRKAAPTDSTKIKDKP